MAWVLVGAEGDAGFAVVGDRDTDPLAGVTIGIAKMSSGEIKTGDMRIMLEVLIMGAGYGRVTSIRAF